MSYITTKDKEVQSLRELNATPLHLPLPADAVAKALANPPFVSLPGSFNLRDCGALCPDNMVLKKVYRSGTLDFMPLKSRQELRNKLGIRQVFDLRRNDEVRSAAPANDGGPEVILCPYMDGKEMPKPVVISDFVSREDGTPGPGFRDMYEDVLGGYTTGYRRVFEALRDAGEGDAILFHCTGGKDRTGVLSALILDLMGAPQDIISLDYSLTRIGGEPYREKIMPAALKALGYPSIDLTNPSGGDTTEGLPLGIKGLFSSEEQVMTGFLQDLHEKYGGAEGYMRKELGFEEADIHKIREQLSPELLYVM